MTPPPGHALYSPLDIPGPEEANNKKHPQKKQNQNNQTQSPPTKHTNQETPKLTATVKKELDRGHAWPAQS